MPEEIADLHALCGLLGVFTEYVDGLGSTVQAPVDTLVAACAALGAPIDGPAQAAAAETEVRRVRGERVLPHVVVAWDGVLDTDTFEGGGGEITVEFEDGRAVEAALRSDSGTSGGLEVPLGYHTIRRHDGRTEESAHLIAAPSKSWRPDAAPGWGVSLQATALRSSRSRSVGDLRDLTAAARWIAARGGDVVAVLPLLPTFNGEPAEPSPYSPVSRLFWNELVLDLGDAHRPTQTPGRLDVRTADREVRAALADSPKPGLDDGELMRYARFRGAQARLGRNWRAWPEAARAGRLADADVDADEERFHLAAQIEARLQMRRLTDELTATGPRLGLDLAVGVHPDGYDPWSRQSLFGHGMAVGAPPDRIFPQGQNWGFPPVLPTASRQEGHDYLVRSIRHLASAAGLLRIDHVMALARLFWIPAGARIGEGTYVRYPLDELFAVLCLESHRNRCEIVGENLGVVPPEIDGALESHEIRGIYLAIGEAESDDPRPPDTRRIATIGTHDTPTFAGWLEGRDIDERVRASLLSEEDAEPERDRRAEAVRRLTETVDAPADDPAALLNAVLSWLARSDSPLVMPWIEDLWLERDQVNLPGTSSAQRENWQRPMALLLDEIERSPEVLARIERLERPGQDPAG